MYQVSSALQCSDGELKSHTPHKVRFPLSEFVWFVQHTELCRLERKYYRLLVRRSNSLS